ncbi:MAG: class I SAM-dependent methyltransferase [Betaproteobacteria bacterium]|nr:class I SAM-dependent methyltransferase [Betaproteobacteria bacterium]
MTSSNATTRFSSRVDDYIKYRPHYPVEVLDLLAAQCDLLPESVIADVGSGTGILTRLFLENGNPVMGVEPNADMREAAETYLADYARFTSLTGTAEATRLPAQSMDFVIAGQAFHWFDRQKARAEFLRILKPEGWVVLLWNDRRIDTTPFLRDYEALLQQFGTDYQEINHKNVQSPDVFRGFFGGAFREACFDNAQHFDFDGMMGRINSSSYVPAKDHPNYPLMAARAREIFDLHQQNGRISFLYDTRVYYGRLL